MSKQGIEKKFHSVDVPDKERGKIQDMSLNLHKHTKVHPLNSHQKYPFDTLLSRPVATQDNQTQAVDPL
jgi:hypothetical protein